MVEKKHTILNKGVYVSFGSINVFGNTANVSPRPVRRPGTFRFTENERINQFNGLHWIVGKPFDHTYIKHQSFAFSPSNIACVDKNATQKGFVEGVFVRR